MPFTLAHPAAIIPFARRQLVPSALIVGSMSPDFLYLINLEPRGQFGHTIPGVFLFCLPIGMVILWIFHRLIKWPMLSLLPFSLQVRLVGPARDFNFWPITRQLLIIASLLIGAFTHIFWDGFTHEYGWAVSILPILNHPVIELDSKSILLCKVLQHSSTMAGSVAILIFIVRWINRAPKKEVSTELCQPSTYKLSWSITLIIVAVLLGLLWSLLIVPQVNEQGGLSKWIGYFVVGTLAGLFIELVLFSFYWLIKRRNSE